MIISKQQPSSFLPHVSTIELLDFLFLFFFNAVVALWGNYLAGMNIIGIKRGCFFFVFPAVQCEVCDRNVRFGYFSST